MRKSFVPDTADLTLADRWILDRLNRTIEDVSRNLDKFELGQPLITFITSPGIISVTGILNWLRTVSMGRTIRTDRLHSMYLFIH